MWLKADLLAILVRVIQLVTLLFILRMLFTIIDAGKNDRFDLFDELLCSQNSILVYATVYLTLATENLLDGRFGSLVIRDRLHLRRSWRLLRVLVGSRFGNRTFR